MEQSAKKNQRRVKANGRERQRMHGLNDALDVLRQVRRLVLTCFASYSAFVVWPRVRGFPWNTAQCINLSNSSVVLVSFDLYILSESLRKPLKYER